VERGWWAARFAPFALGGSPPAPLVAASPTRVVLRIRALGKVQVSIAERPVRIPLSKGMELLVWLGIHEHGTREQIITDLWDGSNEARHAEYFRVAVRRLRAALSAQVGDEFNPIPFDGERYRLSEHIELDLDYLRLRAASSQAEPTALLEALGLYGGRLLPQSESEWVTRRQEELLELGTEACLRCGRTVEANDPTQALEWYRQAERLDGLNEFAQLGQLRSLARLGEVEAARRAHARFAKRLEQDLGVKPSWDLERILESGVVPGDSQG
jgi:two-component SAPR family response regulator